MIELTIPKELMLLRQMNKKIAIFFTIGIFLIKGFKFQPDVCNGCHDVLMTSMNVSIIAFLNADYFCIISEISKTGLTSLYILI